MLHGLALASSKQAQRARKCLGYETSSHYSTTNVPEVLIRSNSDMDMTVHCDHREYCILAASPKARLPSLSRESSPLLHQSIFILREDVTFFFLCSQRTSHLFPRTTCFTSTCTLHHAPKSTAATAPHKVSRGFWVAGVVTFVGDAEERVFW